jgi:flagellum-specific peptidoglycan hydrolase FlgJ
MKTFSEFCHNLQEDRNQKFYNQIKQRALAAGASSIESDTIAAQAALETGYGKYPSGSFNYFGQKGTSRDNTTRLRTREVINGRSVMMNEPFKNYDSLDASIRDRIKKWSYKTRGAESVKDAARRLQIPGGGRIPGSKEISHGAYATDPNYASTVASIARTYGGGGERLPSLRSRSTTTMKPTQKGALNSPSPTRVLAKLKGKTGELDKSTGKFTKRGWSSTEGSRYKKYGGK